MYCEAEINVFKTKKIDPAACRSCLLRHLLSCFVILDRLKVVFKLETSQKHGSRAMPFLEVLSWLNI